MFSWVELDTNADLHIVIFRWGKFIVSPFTKCVHAVMPGKHFIFFFKHLLNSFEEIG